MAKKRKKQSNRKQNIQNARQRAATRARTATTTIPVEEIRKATATGDIVEFTELPDDPLAGEAIKQIAETTDSQVAEAAVAAAEATAEEASPVNAAAEPVTEIVADGVVIAAQDNADALLPSQTEQTISEETASIEAGETPEGEDKEGRKEFPLWGKILIGVVILLAIVLAIGIGYISHFLSRIGRATDEEYVAEESLADLEDEAVVDDSEEVALDTMDPNDITWYGQTIEPMDDDDIKNVLLIGQDRREGDSKSELKRSDAMVILSLNQATGKIKVCSLMRDMYVQIPGYGGNKLNYAYEKGGMELLDQTIEENLGITIDNNVEVDFDGFVDAMSVIGNLDIYLSQSEIDFMEAHPTWADDSGADVTTWDLHEGLNSMTPSEYAVFCRLRMIGNNDFERTERQRRVLSAAFSKIMDGNIFKLLTVADAIIPYVTTDMTNGEILGYVYTVVTKGMELSGQYRIPLDNTWTNQTIHRAAVLVCDMETNTKALQEFLYGDEEGQPFVSEEDRAEQKENGTWSSSNSSYTTKGASGSGSYSSGTGGYSSGTSGNSQTTTTQETVDAEAVADDLDTQAIDETETVVDSTPVDETVTTTDPAVIVTDPAAATDATITDPAAEAAMDAAAAAQAAAAQALAEQAAAAAAAATTTP